MITDNIQQKIKRAKELGYSDSQISTFLRNKGVPPEIVSSSIVPAEQNIEKPEFNFSSTYGELGKDIAETVSAVGSQFGQAGEKIVDTAQDKNLNIFEKFIQGTSQAFRGGARAFGEGVIGVGKMALRQEEEDVVGGAVQDVAKSVSDDENIKALVEKYNSLDPETKRNVDNALGFAEGLAEIATGGAASRVAKPVVKAVAETASKVGSSINDIRSKFGSLFTSPAKTIDEVIDQADNSPASIRARSASEAPELTFKEKWIGISPDIKKRIAGKQEKLSEYFDVAHARNNNDLAPTPYEYGAQQAQKAVGEMETLLNETGGRIGETRKRLGTYKATQDDVAQVEKSFVSELAKLNLEVRGGTVRQKLGTVSKTGTGDVKILNDLYQDLQTVKQSPTLTNLIDFRSGLDARVNFGKRAAEVSNEVDPLSRQVRKNTADVAARIVGKSEAAELKKFSDFMDAYNDLRSYTDRSAGGEYLLKLVLSGRGGEARQIIQTIKEYTGIDLMDDATMMTIATDVVGNSRQQNLFRQEMTKAGLDVAALAAGKPSGAAGLLSDVMTKYLLDQEKIYMKAAE